MSLEFGQTSCGFGQIKAVVTCLQRLRFAETKMNKNTARLFREPLRKGTGALAWESWVKGESSEIRELETGATVSASKVHCAYY